MDYPKNLKTRIKLDEPLKSKTTFKIGGVAKFFVEPKDTADLKLLINWAKRYKIQTFVIGAGSNMLINDKGIKGLVLRLASPYFKKIICSSTHLQAGSGLTLGHLINFTAAKGLSGFEPLVGIPGTIGGALAMNAGAWGRNIGDLLDRVDVLDYNGKVKTLEKKDIKFSYRKSGLAKFIILKARFKLARKNKKEIRGDLARYLKYRRNTQENRLPNAGCVFKNPPAGSAGRLIDLCGLKGETVGGASVSKRHANFIVNKGNARASDVLRLMRIMQKKVKQKFNITLQPEIKLWQ